MADGVNVMLCLLLFPFAFHELAKAGVVVRSEVFINLDFLGQQPGQYNQRAAGDEKPEGE